VLDRLATGDPDPLVRKEAAARVRDESLLRTIAVEDRQGSVRAIALASLQGDQAFFRTIALRDPDPDVRAAAVARLIEPALLAAICRNDPSSTVRLTALQRLTAPAELAAIARTHPDWVVRRAAARRLVDPKALAAVAAADADPDVRRAALLLLDEKSIVGIVRTAPSARARAQAVPFVTNQETLEQLARESTDRTVRLAAIERLSDPDAIRRLSEELNDADLRAAALDRATALAGQSADPRNVALRSILLDPAIRTHYGRLDLDFQVWTDERRYVKGGEDAGDPVRKGKVLLENVRVVISQEGKVLFRRTYRGNKPKKAESFNPGVAMSGGYAIRVNPAEVDLLEISAALLESLQNQARKDAVRSKNKYISTAAAALVDSSRRIGVAAVQSDDEGDDDGD
jgi:hypothetical protein